MKCRFIATPYTSKAMTSFGMNRTCKTLVNHAPLYRQVLSLINRQTFINRPTRGQMIQNNMMLSVTSSTYTVSVSFIFITYPDTNIAYDYFACIHN